MAARASTTIAVARQCAADMRSRATPDAGGRGVYKAERIMRIVAYQPAESHQNNAPKSPSETSLPFHYLASSLAHLLETARRALDSDREAAKASLVTASYILQSEIERHSGANGSRPAALAGWQMARVRAFIEENLHRNIGAEDLSTVARRSRGHFSRSFKQTFGEPPHAYVVKRRLARACHLMLTGSGSLSEIALSVGFSDQAHLSRRFRRAFNQCPSIWRREHELPRVISRAGMEENGPPSLSQMIRRIRVEQQFPD
jgi:AraC-like DNA-binding protein